MISGIRHLRNIPRDATVPVTYQYAVSSYHVQTISRYRA